MKCNKYFTHTDRYYIRKIKIWCKCNGHFSTATVCGVLILSWPPSVNMTSLQMACLTRYSNNSSALTMASFCHISRVLVAARSIRLLDTMWAKCQLSSQKLTRHEAQLNLRLAVAIIVSSSSSNSSSGDTLGQTAADRTLSMAAQSTVYNHTHTYTHMDYPTTKLLLIHQQTKEFS